MSILTSIALLFWKEMKQQYKNIEIFDGLVNQISTEKNAFLVVICRVFSKKSPAKALISRMK